MPFFFSSSMALAVFRWGHAHAFKDLRRLGELAIVVGHDLDAVAPGIENVHAVVDAFDAAPLHRLAHRFTIVDDETEMALGVGACDRPRVSWIN